MAVHCAICNPKTSSLKLCTPCRTAPENAGWSEGDSAELGTIEDAGDVVVALDYSYAEVVSDRRAGPTEAQVRVAAIVVGVTDVRLTSRDIAKLANVSFSYAARLRRRILAEPISRAAKHHSHRRRM